MDSYGSYSHIVIEDLSLIVYSAIKINPNKFTKYIHHIHILPKNLVAAKLLGLADWWAQAPDTTNGKVIDI